MGLRSLNQTIPSTASEETKVLPIQPLEKYKTNQYLKTNMENLPHSGSRRRVCRQVVGIDLQVHSFSLILRFLVADPNKNKEAQCNHKVANFSARAKMP